MTHRLIVVGYNNTPIYNIPLVHLGDPFKGFETLCGRLGDSILPKLDGRKVCKTCQRMALGGGVE